MTCRAGTGLSSGSPAAGWWPCIRGSALTAEPRTRVAGLGVDVTASRDGDMPASGCTAWSRLGDSAYPRTETAPPDDPAPEVSVQRGTSLASNTWLVNTSNQDSIA